MLPHADAFPVNLIYLHRCAKMWHENWELSLANNLGLMQCFSAAVVIFNVTVLAAGLATLSAFTRLSKHPTVYIFSPSCIWKAWVWSTAWISSILILNGTTRFGIFEGLQAVRGLSFDACFSEGSAHNYVHMFLRFPKPIWALNQGCCCLAESLLWNASCWASHSPSPTPPAASLW